MCDETFKVKAEEAMRLARTHTVIKRKKKKVVDFGEEVKKLKNDIDNVSSRRHAASQQ